MLRRPSSESRSESKSDRSDHKREQRHERSSEQRHESASERKGERKNVRYITRDLVARTTLQRSGASELHLSPRFEGDARIRVIQNLEGPSVAQLRVLCLANNAIERLENLGALAQLQVLDVSGNRLRRLDGLSGLGALLELQASDNVIERLPTGLGAWVPRLRLLALRNNALDVLADAERLRPLRNLTALDVRYNPWDALPHWRLALLHAVPGLAVLNGAEVDEDELSCARERFGRRK